MAVPSPFAERPGSDADEARWWRAAVVYQVYVRSFADSNGDGIGDLPGITERLDAIAELGVDAIWLTPFYISPQNDGGYDVADYRAVDPVFGTLADAEALIARAHNVGLKVMVDIVPNHTSSMHRWFAEARAGGVEDDAWGRYHCLPGTGPDRTAPPNDWMSVFGGDAWSPVLDHDGNPSGYWYLHLFDTSQPDLNWNHPDVHREMADTLRFWFDRGVDGFRIDVAHGLVKAPGYPSLASVGATAEDGAVELFGEVEVAPYWDQPGVHDIFRAWRAIADSYDPPKAFCGEVWVSTPERQAAYVRGDELNTVFNFDFLKAPWHAPGIRAIVDHSLHANGLVGAPTTWVLSNHDVTRHASRYAQDPGLALLRARAMTTFMLALPGSAYLYQGEELGLPEVFDIAEDMRADPIFFRTAGEQLGRDGCRVPLPWEAGHRPTASARDTCPGCHSRRRGPTTPATTRPRTTRRCPPRTPPWRCIGDCWRCGRRIRRWAWAGSCSSTARWTGWSSVTTSSPTTGPTRVTARWCGWCSIPGRSPWRCRERGGCWPPLAGRIGWSRRRWLRPRPTP